MTNVTLTVDGMTCDGCVNSIKSALMGVAGVGQVEIELGAGRVAVDYDDTQVKSDELITVIESRGFDVL